MATRKMHAWRLSLMVVLVACGTGVAVRADVRVAPKDALAISLPFNLSPMQPPAASVGAPRLWSREQVPWQREWLSQQQSAAAEEKQRMDSIEKAVRAAEAAARAAAESAKAAARSAEMARKASEAATAVARRIKAAQPTAQGPARSAATGQPIVICTHGDRDPSCTYTNLQDAFRAAHDGSTVTIRPGIYHQGAVIAANDLTVHAKGAHLQGVAVEGKAALVVKGTYVTIIGLECSDVVVPDGNGACIRVEATGLIMRNMYIHDNQIGVLGGALAGDVVIENCTFEHNGQPGGGLGHSIYLDGRSVTIRDSRILASRNEGHEVKSRAGKTIIENSVIAALGEVNSRLIDIPNGGELVVRNCILEDGPRTENPELIGFGLEGIRAGRRNSIAVTDSTVIVDRAYALWLRGRNLEPAHINISNNTVIGRFDDQGHDSRMFRSRAAAGYPPFPALTK